MKIDSFAEADIAGLLSAYVKRNMLCEAVDAVNRRQDVQLLRTRRGKFRVNFRSAVREAGPVSCGPVDEASVDNIDFDDTFSELGIDDTSSFTKCSTIMPSSAAVAKSSKKTGVNLVDTLRGKENVHEKPNKRHEVEL